MTNPTIIVDYKKSGGNQDDRGSGTNDIPRVRYVINLKKMAVVLNGFIHDFATGYWLSAMIVIGFLDRFRGEYPALTPQLALLERFFFWNTMGAALVILATGSVRTFTYVENFYGPEAEKTRRIMLFVKHVVLLAVFGIGGWWAYRVTFAGYPNCSFE